MTTPASISTYTGGPTFSVKVSDIFPGEIEFAACVPENMWLGLAFGEGMKGGIDMVVFQGKDNGIVTDLWSMIEDTP